MNASRKDAHMSHERELTDTLHASNATGKTAWESPTVRRVGNLGEVLLGSGKQGLSEADPGQTTYKPQGQDHK
jgi:hypothetical protein